jgi:D-alanine-D-alanine ligase
MSDVSDMRADWHLKFFASDVPGRPGKYDESDHSRLQVDFIASCLRLTRESTVLDLCCGKGRHLLEFLRRGFDVAGVESSTSMVSECRRLAASEGLTPELETSDVRQFESSSVFDAVYMVLPAIGFFGSDQDDHQIVRNVSRALRERGLLFMDLVPLEGSIRTYEPERRTTDGAGNRVVKRREYDPGRGPGLCLGSRSARPACRRFHAMPSSHGTPWRPPMH